MAFHPSNPGIDYTLRWPRSLFTAEAQVVLSNPNDTEMAQEAELLLEDAFGSDEPRRDFVTSSRRLSPFDPAAPAAELARAFGDDPRRKFLKRVVAHAHRLPEETSPRPYYAVRTGKAPTPDPWLAHQKPAQAAWRAAVRSLQDRGYLDQAAPRDRGDQLGRARQDALLDEIVRDRLGDSDLWWSTRTGVSNWWSDAQFFSLVEVFHDLVARPRRGSGEHETQIIYAGFAVEPGRVLYRWTVNRLLEQHALDLQLASEGEDVGRLVHAPTDGRQELVDAAVSAPDDAGDKVRHAVALFRSRETSVEQKRSACIALAGVLEARRALLKAELLSKDEGALFNIANNFAIRHQDATQRPDYDEAYLEWIYWWYLATVELTNRLIARNESSGG